MNVLAINTSSRHRTVCISATAEGVLRHAEVRDGSAVSRAIPASLAPLLADGPAAVVVVDGPGSYTGVRAGMAAALGVAHARGLRLHTAGALEVIAAGVPRPRQPCWVAADAGRGAIYIARLGAADGWHRSVPLPRRTPAAALRLDGLPVFSADPIALPGVAGVDPAAALAAAVPAALARPPADLVGLTAIYIG
jgi:tRNA threonylcarbamoyladenosine biosynthesis protein TsaB